MENAHTMPYFAQPVDGGSGVLQTRDDSVAARLIGSNGTGEVMYVPAEIRHCETLAKDSCSSAVASTPRQ